MSQKRNLCAPLGLLTSTHDVTLELYRTYIRTYVCTFITYMHISNYIHVPDFGHSKHCPDEANDTPDNSKQHWSYDNKSSLTDSPPQ